MGELGISLFACLFIALGAGGKTIKSILRRAGRSLQESFPNKAPGDRAPCCVDGGRTAPYDAPVKGYLQTAECSLRAAGNRGGMSLRAPGLERRSRREAQTRASRKDQNQLRHPHTHPHLAQRVCILAPTACALWFFTQACLVSLQNVPGVQCRQRLRSCREPRAWVGGPVFSRLRAPHPANSPSVCRHGRRQVTDVPLPATLTLQSLHLRCIPCFLKNTF